MEQDSNNFNSQNINKINNNKNASLNNSTSSQDTNRYQSEQNKTYFQDFNQKLNYNQQNGSTNEDFNNTTVNDQETNMHQPLQNEVNTIPPIQNFNNNINTKQNMNLNNSQPLNTQGTNIDSQPTDIQQQSSLNHQQTINQINTQKMTLQSTNSFENGSNSNQNVNSKFPKKKILYLIIGIAVILVIGTVIGFKTIFNSNSNNKKQEESDIMNSDEFSFLYDFYSISEDYLNSINKNYEHYESLKLTNKDVLSSNIESSIGNIWENLSVKNTGFSEIIPIHYKNNVCAKCGTDYYTLKVEKNTFLFPKQIKVIDSKTTNVSSKLEFYVIGNDLKNYSINLSVEEIPKNIELKGNKWMMYERDGKNENVSYYSITSYYKLNNEYCLELEFPAAYSDEIKKEYGESEYSGAQYPDNKENIKELANKITSLITLTKNEVQTAPKYYYFTVSADDYNINQNTIINLSTMKFSSWHSGATSINGSKNPFILAYNSNYSLVQLEEISNKTYEALEKKLLADNMALKEYIYKNRTIYISYYTDKAYGDFKGNYTGIILKDDKDKFYKINYAFKIFDPNKGNVDEWISTMCSGIITFN